MRPTHIDFPQLYTLAGDADSADQASPNAHLEMQGGSVLAQNLQQLNDKFKTQMMNQEPIIVYEDDEPPIAATHSGGADNNDPFYLPTRSTCWAAAIMEYRERTFNQGY